MKTITFNKKRGTKKVIDFGRELSYYFDDLFLDNQDFDGNELPAEEWTLTDDAGNVILQGREAIESPTGVLDLDGEYDTVYVEDLNNLSSSEIELLREYYTSGAYIDSDYMEDVLSILGCYEVNDTETGNCVIYRGANPEEAKEAILSDDDPESWDLYKDGERIWCGEIDTLSDLDNII